MKTYTDILLDTNVEGLTKIQDGYYLWTRQQIIEEQKTWEDEDESKNLDFTIAEYWLEISGETMTPINNAQDLFDVFEGQ